ncbi:MAG TPA: hypothetical protein VGH19_14580, partial [Verrucomicrobiae bacterium]
CWFECFFVFTCSVWRSQNPQTSIFCFYSCGLLLISNLKFEILGYRLFPLCHPHPNHFPAEN